MSKRRKLKLTEDLEAPYIEFEGQKFINFCSNDTLNLSKHPKLIAGAINATKEFGTSASSSRLLTGTKTYHQELETKLALFTNREAALLFPSGYQLNSSLLPCLNAKTLLLDHSCHKSLITGALASKAKLVRYRHQDLGHLESLLQKAEKPAWIVTESLFSMEGDFTDLPKLINLKKAFGAHLLVDDAHAFGVIKANGSADHLEIDLFVATFGKAFGCSGAFLACSNDMLEHLVNVCPGLIYTTAMAPPTLGAINACLDLMPSLDDRRTHLASLVKCMSAKSHIIPILATDNLEDKFKEKGLLSFTVRPPTVQKAILRLSLTSAHSEKHIGEVRNAVNALIHCKIGSRN